MWRPVFHKQLSVGLTEVQRWTLKELCECHDVLDAFDTAFDEELKKLEAV